MIFRSTLFCLIIPYLSFSQVQFGVGGYTEYQIGNLPLIISVPHGGTLNPDSIPNRNCPNAVWTTDAYTVELARNIQLAFIERTGCSPHMVYSHLHRKKIDLNRNQAEATCNNPQVVPVFQDFHDFIDAARNNSIEQFGFAFYLDLHGHGNQIQRVELGYLLYEEELEESDDMLNSELFISYSSMQRLAQTHPSGLTHAEIIRGNHSFGNLLEMRNYSAVPSLNQPAPGIGTNYFSGGFNTRYHTGYSAGIQSDGVQMECNYTGIRDSEENRLLFASEFVDAMLSFLEIHYGYASSSCLLQAPGNEINQPTIYPNPANSGDQIKLNDHQNTTKISLFDFTGSKLIEINATEGIFQLPVGLSSGIYYIEWSEDKTIHQARLIIK
jgi:hypothetical protein